MVSECLTTQRDAKIAFYHSHSCSVKNEKKNGGKPPFQVHYQEAQYDGGFTGSRKLGHDPIQTVATFALSELAFNRVPVDLILSGLLSPSLEFLGIGLGHFRRSP